MTITYKKYSEAIKKQVVANYDQGTCISELNRKFGITGGETVKNWIKKYANEGFRYKYMRVQTIKEIKQVKTLVKRIKELEQALGKTSLEKLKLECMIEEFEETYGLDQTKKKKFNHYPTHPKSHYRTMISHEHGSDLCYIPHF